MNLKRATVAETPTRTERSMPSKKKTETAELQTTRLLGQILAENLRRGRERMELTQVELAARADMSPGMVAQIEQGVRGASLGTIERLAGALNLYDTPWKLLLPHGRAK